MLILKRVSECESPRRSCMSELSQRAYRTSRMPTCLCLCSPSPRVSNVPLHHEQKGISSFFCRFPNLTHCSLTLSLKSGACFRKNSLKLWEMRLLAFLLRVRWENWYCFHVCMADKRPTASRWLDFVHVKHTRAANDLFYQFNLPITSSINRLVYKMSPHHTFLKPKTTTVVLSEQQFKT